MSSCQNIFPIETEGDGTHAAALARNAVPFHFSNLSFGLFVFLQALDVLTTMIGLRHGAKEGNLVISGIMHLGTVPALLISKAISIVLVTAAVAFGRSRMLSPLNVWYAILVFWNLAIIYLAA